ncbi:MAG TPA: carboxymuconolactone decarboxylase family protein [Methylomirabilota bacterium]|nr:carboxymuconolactone decarboxylase family protein [Methylomirabilota bacterium]
MARLNAVDTATASSKITELFGQVEKKLGRVPNMMRTMAVSPTVLEAYLSFSGALAGGALPPRLREQIALTVGEANRCEYCLSAHTAIGKRLGLTEDEVAASREAAAGDPKVQTALRFARALVERRGEVTDAELARVREAGWSDGELAEIIAHVALNVFTNYFNIAAGTDIDFPRVPVGAARG